MQIHETAREAATRYLAAERPGRTQPFAIHDLGLCPRLRLLRALRPSEARFSEEGLGVLCHGLLVEGFFANLAGSFDEAVEFQARIERPDFRIEGHLDVYFPASHTAWETKTISIRVSLPMEHHLWQVHGYLTFGRLDGVTLIYAPREDFLALKTFEIKPSREWRAKIIAAQNEAIRLYEAQQIPEIPEGYQRAAFPCLWKSKTFERPCEYHHLCWPETTEQEELKMAETFDTGLVDELLTAKEALEEAKANYDAIYNRLLAIAPKVPGERIEVRGAAARATIQTILTRRLDTRRIKTQYPDIAQECTIEVPVTRLQLASID